MDMKFQIIGKCLFYHMEGVEHVKHGRDVMRETDVYAVVQDLHLDLEQIVRRKDIGT